MKNQVDPKIDGYDTEHKRKRTDLHVFLLPAREFSGSIRGMLPLIIFHRATLDQTTHQAIPCRGRMLDERGE
jgi:hypothetical protein